MILRLEPSQWPEAQRLGDLEQFLPAVYPLPAVLVASLSPSLGTAFFSEQEIPGEVPKWLC